MKKLFIMIGMLCTGGALFAQSEADYLKKETDRIGAADQNEIKIESFITENMGNFNLTPEALDRVTYPVIEDVKKTLTGQELQDAIDEAKRIELRKLYFSRNPETAELYLAAVTPLTCTNGDFSNNTSGFSFASKRYTQTTWSVYNNFPSFTANIVTPSANGIATIVTHTADPITGQFRSVAGNAIRLNNSTDGQYDVTSMRRTFPVGNSTEMSFKFALVFQNPTGHDGPPSTQPYFQWRLLNAAGAVLAHREIISTPTPGLFHEINTAVRVLWTDWVCESVNLSQYANQNVTLEITVSDCGKSAHYGYAYLDDFCGPVCSNHTFGDLTVNPVGQNCPTFPLNVTGTYAKPTGTNLVSLTLNVLNSSGVSVGSMVLPATTTSPFTFPLTAAHFANATTGNFEIRVTALFSDGNSIVVTSANTGPDVSFENCDCCSSCCQATNTVTEAVANNQTHTKQASSTLFAKNEIFGTALYHAQTVVLQPPFHAQPSTSNKVHVYDEGCAELYQNRQAAPEYTAAPAPTPIQEEIQLVPVTDSEKIQVLPNPTSGIFKAILNDLRNGNIEVTDMSGAVILRKAFKDQKEVEINIQGQPKGIYIVNIVSGKQTYTKKIIKN